MPTSSRLATMRSAIGWKDSPFDVRSLGYSSCTVSPSQRTGRAPPAPVRDRAGRRGRATGCRGSASGSPQAPARRLRRRVRGCRRSRGRSAPLRRSPGWTSPRRSPGWRWRTGRRSSARRCSSIVRPSAPRSGASWSLERSMTMSALPFCTSIACVVHVAVAEHDAVERRRVRSDVRRVGGRSPSRRWC